MMANVLRLLISEIMDTCNLLKRIVEMCVMERSDEEKGLRNPFGLSNWFAYVYHRKTVYQNF